MGRGGGLLKTPPSAGGAAGIVRGAAERAGGVRSERRSARSGARGRAAGMLAPLLGSAGSGWLLLGECSPEPPRQRGLSFSPPLSLLPGSFLRSGWGRSPRLGTVVLGRALRSGLWASGPAPHGPPCSGIKGIPSSLKGRGRRERHSAWGWGDARRDACGGEPAP